MVLLQEAKHVFIDNGLLQIYDCEINILELGFGTGLNVLVTFDEFLKTDKNHIIRYFTIEKYPVNESEIADLNYNSLFNNPEIENFNKKIHYAELGKRG